MATWNILHCGGDEETYFIEHLKKEISKANVHRLLEYTTYQPQQSKDVILYHDAQKYRDNKFPCIVLISQVFFDLIWKTTYKNPLVQIISHSMKNCLHVWMDVNESDIKRYSSRLVSQDHNFKSVPAHELTTKLESKEMVNRIRSLLDSSDEKVNALNNYAVDDKEEEMRISFANHYQLPLLEECKVVPKRQKKKKDLYKDVLRMSAFPSEELEAIAKDTPPHQLNNNELSSKAGVPRQTAVTTHKHNPTQNITSTKLPISSIKDSQINTGSSTKKRTNGNRRTSPTAVHAR